MQRAGHQSTGTVRATPPSPPVVPNTAAVSLRLLNVDSVCEEPSSHDGPQQGALAAIIQQRIESRLHGRVRNLVVRAEGEIVTLEGECATYYTKQIAQHTAMGVLDDEHLENAIVVNVPR
jgi:hypothetical protein